jgi:flagellar hook-associated protein 1
MRSLQIGLSALQASQAAIDTTANNVGNANTPGYHRQRVEFRNRLPLRFINLYLGSGVDVQGIRSIRNGVIESALTYAVSDQAQSDQQLQSLTDIESLFAGGSGSLANRLQSIFSEIRKLNSAPTESIQRRSTVEAGSLLANQFRDVYLQLKDMKVVLRDQIRQEISAANNEIKQVAKLNKDINTSSAHGTANDLYDQRDQVINQLAERIDIRRNENHGNRLEVGIGGSSASVNVDPIELALDEESSGRLRINIKGTERAVKLESGRLAALVDLYNNVVDKYEGKLNDMSSSFMQSFDQVHAKGLGKQGPFALLASTRFVSDANVPLAQANTVFEIKPGDLYVSVTAPDGQRSTTKLSIDPATQSLSDFAAALGTIPNLQGTIDSQTNRLTILATPGYKFDFAGRLDTLPDITNYTGTSTTNLSGRYTGTENRRLQVEILGSGTIGVTPGLMARVSDELGNPLFDINIGEDYEPGSPIELIDGAALSFASGDVTAGDTLGVPLVADSDSTGILAALGLNSFFQGRDASDMKIDTALLADPNRLAVSSSGEIGDVENLRRLAAVETEPIINGISVVDFLAEITTEIGIGVQVASDMSEQSSVQRQRMIEQQASFSGVDPNEELIKMAQYQQSYESALKILQTVQQMMDEVMSMVR